jgi:hypothetical protein
MFIARRLARAAVAPARYVRYASTDVKRVRAS